MNEDVRSARCIIDPRVQAFHSSSHIRMWSMRVGLSVVGAIASVGASVRITLPLGIPRRTRSAIRLPDGHDASWVRGHASRQGWSFTRTVVRL